MWTARRRGIKIHRRQGGRVSSPRRIYPSDLTDAQWALIDVLGRASTRQPRIGRDSWMRERPPSVDITSWLETRLACGQRRPTLA
jgi:hypothetical protein